MFSLTIHFGPNAMVWAFLFKNKERAHQAVASSSGGFFNVEDDFGQTACISASSVHGTLVEDLDLVEAARIQRSLAEERCKVKLMQAAKTDPVISQAMRGGPQVLQPRFNG